MRTVFVRTKEIFQVDHCDCCGCTAIKYNNCCMDNVHDDDLQVYKQVKAALTKNIPFIELYVTDSDDENENEVQCRKTLYDP